MIFGAAIYEEGLPAEHHIPIGIGQRRRHLARIITGLRTGTGCTDSRVIVAAIGSACKACWGSTADDPASNSSAANATRCLESKSIAGA